MELGGWIHAFTTGCRSIIWNNFQNVSFSLISPIFEKKAINLNFHDYYSSPFVKLKFRPI